MATFSRAQSKILRVSKTNIILINFDLWLVLSVNSDFSSPLIFFDVNICAKLFFNLTIHGEVKVWTNIILTFKCDHNFKSVNTILTRDPILSKGLGSQITISALQVLKTLFYKEHQHFTMITK